MGSIESLWLETWKQRRAWTFTATSRTKERFARTSLGSLWLGISNIISVIVLGTIYGRVLDVGEKLDYIVYLGIGLALWNYISTCLSSAAELFKRNREGIKNRNTHPSYYVMEEWLFQLQSVLQGLGPTIAILSLTRPLLLFNAFIYGVLPMMNLALMMLWLPLIVCIVGARFEDLYQLIPIALQVIFLTSPILYKREALGSLEWLPSINPVYVVLEHTRSAIVSGQIELSSELTILALNIGGLLLGSAMLKRLRKQLPFLV